jgi:hypothetical protein
MSMARAGRGCNRPAMRPGGVWLVIGVQAAGKSTIADLLARRFDRGVHLRGAQFYRWAVRGWVHTGPANQSGARADLELRYRLAGLVADQYAAAGSTTVVQDNIFGADVVAWLRELASRPRHLVVLRPSADVVRQRDDARRRETGKVAYRPDGHTVEELDGFLAQTPPVGLWLDTSSMTAAATVDEIVRRQPEAVVDDAI